MNGVHKDITDVGGRVTNGDGAFRVLGDVVLHVTNNSAHVLGSSVGGILVDDLISSEESEKVVVVLEAFNDTEDLLVVDSAVGGPGSAAVQVTTLQRVADIEDHVDTGGVEDGDAFVVVQAGLEVVDTDSVNLLRHELLSRIQGNISTYTQALHEGSIAQTDLAIAERVELRSEAGGTTGLVVDTNDLEAITVVGVDEVLSCQLMRVSITGYRLPFP